MKKNRALISFLVLMAILPVQAKNKQENESVSSVNIGHQEEQIPLVIQSFKGLDFDGRSELREYLMQKQNVGLSSELVESLSDNLKFEQKQDCLEIMSLGKTLADISEQNISIVDIAKSCGFLRLAKFWDFKKNPDNKGKFFLDDKKPLEASALMAEMSEFVEVYSLFEARDWSSLRGHLMQENWHYEEKHPRFLRLYNEHLQQKINIRLQNEKKNLQVKNR
jgi:hypothetical protein